MAAWEANQSFGYVKKGLYYFYWKCVCMFIFVCIVLLYKKYFYFNKVNLRTMLTEQIFSNREGYYLSHLSSDESKERTKDALWGFIFGCRSRYWQ